MVAVSLELAKHIFLIFLLKVRVHQARRFDVTKLYVIKKQIYFCDLNRVVSYKCFSFGKTMIMIF